MRLRQCYIVRHHILSGVGFLSIFLVSPFFPVFAGEADAVLFAAELEDLPDDDVFEVPEATEVDDFAESFRALCRVTLHFLVTHPSRVPAPEVVGTAGSTIGGALFKALCGVGTFFVFTAGAGGGGGIVGPPAMAVTRSWLLLLEKGSSPVAGFVPARRVLGSSTRVLFGSSLREELDDSEFTLLIEELVGFAASAYEWGSWFIEPVADRKTDPPLVEAGGSVDR